MQKPRYALICLTFTLEHRKSNKISHNYMKKTFFFNFCSIECRRPWTSRASGQGNVFKIDSFFKRQKEGSDGSGGHDL